MIRLGFNSHVKDVDGTKNLMDMLSVNNVEYEYMKTTHALMDITYSAVIVVTHAA